MGSTVFRARLEQRDEQSAAALPSKPEEVGSGARTALLAALRSATRADHERIEAILPLARPGIDRASYRALLAALYGFHSPLERELGRVDGLRALGLDCRLRRRSHLLRRDLLSLGMTLPDVARLPRCTDLPSVRPLAAALGCLYVVEGSTLGGQVLAGRAREALGVGLGDGASFFHGYGPATGAMWSAFVAALAALPPDEAAERAAVSAAVATFGAIERWLRARGAAP
jgi:heme oxygenase (biliverdin-IX-beta and delta-forming)